MIEKKYVVSAIHVAWPAVLESFFISLAGMIDTMMVSSLGSYAVAAVGLTTQPKFIGFSIFISINIALSALVARRKGEERQRSANETLLSALTISLILCLAVTVAMVAFTEPIMKFAGANADTLDPSSRYFRIIMGGMFFNIITLCINAAQRGSGNTIIAFTTNLVSSLVNIAFNYLLIQGNLGFPKLGIEGAALATVLGTVVSAIMSFQSLFQRNSYVRIAYMIKRKLRPTMEAVKSISNLAINLFVENIFMRIGFLATALMAAGLGTAAFAAHNVGMNLLNLGFAFADGMQVAAVALTGESLGAGKKEQALAYGKVCQRIGFVISVALSLFLLVFGRGIYGLHFQEADIINDGVMISHFIMVIVLLQISQLIYGGCLRAAGDVRYCLMSSLVSVTIIRTLVTFVLVQVFHLGLVGIWLGVGSDQFSRFVFMSLRFRQKKWLNIKI